MRATTRDVAELGGGDENDQPGEGEDVPGVEESKGEEQPGSGESKGEDDTGEDWEERICEISGLPYFFSPSQQLSRWTASGTNPEEDFEFADSFAMRSSSFSSVNPLHASGES